MTLTHFEFIIVFYVFALQGLNQRIVSSGKFSKAAKVAQNGKKMKTNISTWQITFKELQNVKCRVLW